MNTSKLGQLLRILTLVFCFWALYNTARGIGVNRQKGPRLEQVRMAVSRR